MFQFKEFSVEDSACGMKIGVDGVLLGAWSNVNGEQILDVGSGSGLLMLMAAQRNPSAKIFGVELEKEAHLQCIRNIERSTFRNDFHHLNVDFHQFDSTELFDSIVSNPPFYDGSTSENKKRELARNKKHLPLDQLIQKSKDCLKKNGKLSLIYPIDALEILKKLCDDNGMRISRICYIKGNAQSEAKRMMVEITNTTESIYSPKEEELTIEMSRGNYTEEYITLTKDFYLKF